MYSFKKYAHNGDFIAEIPQKFIKNIPTFHETINSGQGELSLEFSKNISENFLKFGELVKIFYDGRLIYSGFVSRIEKIFSEKNSIVFYLIGIFENVNNFRTNMIPSYVPAGTGTIHVNHDYVNNDTLVFLRGIVELFNSVCNIFKYDESKIFKNSPNFDKRITGTIKDLFTHYRTEYDMNFYIGADGILRIGNQSKIHNLFYGKDILEIKEDLDITTMVNHATCFKVENVESAVGEYYDTKEKRNKIRYEKRDRYYFLECKDEESIKKYGIRYKHFGDIRSNANKFIENIIKEKKDPIKNIKLKIFNKKWFGILQVMDYITVKNIKEEIENKKIVKISYNENYMEVELENYNTLGNELLGQ